MQADTHSGNKLFGNGHMNIPVKISISSRLGLWLVMSMAPVILMCHFAVSTLDAQSPLVPKQDAVLLIVACTIVSVVSMLVTWSLFLFPLGRKLKQLRAAANQLSTGNTSEPVVYTSDDELGLLSRTLVQLAESSTKINKKHEIDRQSLNHQATHDELTGLSNRKYGNETISKLNKTDSEFPTSILFLDLDGFKAVNDTCGHAVGDEILVAVSLRLKAILRKDTVLIRWGGDEFVIVLPNADQRHAISVAQDVAGLFKQPISTTQGIHKLGCSIGLATSRSNTSLDEVLQEADAKMYENKKKRKSNRSMDSHALDAANDPLAQQGMDRAA